MWRGKTPARKNLKFSSPGKGWREKSQNFPRRGRVGEEKSQNFPRRGMSRLAKTYKFLAKSTNSSPKYTKMSQFPAMARKKSKFSSPGKGWREKSQNFPRRGRVGEEKSGFQTRGILAIPRPVPPYPAKGCLGKKNAGP